MRDEGTSYQESQSLPISGYVGASGHVEYFLHRTCARVEVRERRPSLFRHGRRPVISRAHPGSIAVIEACAVRSCGPSGLGPGCNILQHGVAHSYTVRSISYQRCKLVNHVTEADIADNDIISGVCHGPTAR